MSAKRRQSVTTIETHDLIMRSATRMPTVLCTACPDRVGMLTPREVAWRAGISQLTVYRWLEGGRIHFVETTSGDLFVCLAPLVAEFGSSLIRKFR